MALALNTATPDRCMESSTTTGTGSYTLAGSVTGYASFANSVPTGATVKCCAMDVDVNGVPSGDWEVGLYTFTSPSTLARTRIDESTNGDAAVNWSAGTRRVFICRTGRNGVPINGWTIRNGIVWNDDLAPDAIGIACPDNASINLRLLTRSLGGASLYSAEVTLASNVQGVNSNAIGLYVYDGTKAAGIEILGQSTAAGGNGIYQLRAGTYATLTSSMTVLAGPTRDLITGLHTFRITQDVTNRKYWYYKDGAWVEFLSHAAGTHLTETDVGFGGFSVTGLISQLLVGSAHRWRLKTTAQ